MKTLEVKIDFDDESLEVRIKCPKKTEYLRYWRFEGFLARAVAARGEESMGGTVTERGSLGHVLEMSQRWQLGTLDRWLFDIIETLLNLPYENSPDVRAILYNRATRELEKLKTHVDADALRRAKT